jgi:hypothetical protein
MKVVQYSSHRIYTHRIQIDVLALLGLLSNLNWRSSDVSFIRGRSWIVISLPLALWFGNIGNALCHVGSLVGIDDTHIAKCIHLIFSMKHI